MTVNQPTNKIGALNSSQNLPPVASQSHRVAARLVAMQDSGDQSMITSTSTSRSAQIVSRINSNFGSEASVAHRGKRNSSKRTLSSSKILPNYLSDQVLLFLSLRSKTSLRRWRWLAGCCCSFVLSGAPNARSNLPGRKQLVREFPSLSFFFSIHIRLASEDHG